MSLINDNIKFIRKKSGLTQQGFADKIGVNRPVVGAYEEGRAEPKIATLKKISDEFSVPVDVLISRDLGSLTDKELDNFNIDVSGARLRVLSITVDESDNENVEMVPNKAAAGYTNGFSDPEYLQELPRLYVPNLHGGTHRAFEINGDSMLPLQSGTVIIGRYIDNWHEVKNDLTYVVVTKNDGVVYKRVENKIYDSGALMLHSDNKSYTSFELPVEDVLEIWEAKMYLSSTFPEPIEGSSKEESADDSKELMSMILDLKKEVDTLKKK